MAQAWRRHGAGIKKGPEHNAPSPPRYHYRGTHMQLNYKALPRKNQVKICPKKGKLKLGKKKNVKITDFVAEEEDKCRNSFTFYRKEEDSGGSIGYRRGRRRRIPTVKGADFKLSDILFYYFYLIEELGRIPAIRNFRQDIYSWYGGSITTLESIEGSIRSLGMSGPHSGINNIFCSTNIWTYKLVDEHSGRTRVFELEGLHIFDRETFSNFGEDQWNLKRWEIAITLSADMLERIKNNGIYRPDIFETSGMTLLKNGEFYDISI